MAWHTRQKSFRAALAAWLLLTSSTLVVEHTHVGGEVPHALATWRASPPGAVPESGTRAVSAGFRHQHLVVWGLPLHVTRTSADAPRDDVDDDLFPRLIEEDTGPWIRVGDSPAAKVLAAAAVLPTTPFQPELPPGPVPAAGGRFPVIAGSRSGTLRC